MLPHRAIVLAIEEVDVGWRMVVAAIDVECSSVVGSDIVVGGSLC